MNDTRLQPITLKSFVGGLNLRQNNFNLEDDESPDMLNVEVDPRGGFYSRKGWNRWNAVDIGNANDWDPRNGYVHPLSNGDFVVYIANNDEILSGGGTGVFESLSITADANPHLADFASWGDTVYIACGHDRFPHKRDGSSLAEELSDASFGFNNDYTTPVGGRMPKCDYVEAHTGYLFAASTYEDFVHHPNRLRWSHPSQVEDWAELDYIDIEAGGGGITGLVSFQDHLLIFKTESIWALYGYDSESWQLIRVSRAAGAPTLHAITASETAVFFYSSAGRSGIYAYSGGTDVVHLSEKLRTAMEEVERVEDIWLGWVGRRLWTSVPWQPDGSENDRQSNFVFDPEVGRGAWVRHEAALGNLTLILANSDTQIGYPLGAIQGADAACLVRLEYQVAAEDEILLDDIQTPFPSRYRTGWKDAGWIERLKSWRRPRFILRNPNSDVSVLVEAFYDYDVNTVIRSSQLTVDGPSGGGLFWRDLGAAAPEGDGWDWDDGTIWPAAAAGSQVRRGQPFGHSRALQLRFSVTPTTLGSSWGVDAIELKYLLRRFTT